MTSPIVRILAGTVLARFVLAGPVRAQEVIVGPDAELLGLLHAKLSDRVPDFEGMARRSGAVGRADEFDRAAVLAGEIARLSRVWSDLREDAAVQIDVSTRLGKYGADAGGFPIVSFDPGTFVNGEVPITFRNASAARIFAVPMENGRETLARTDFARSVIATVTLEDLAASEMRSNTPDGRIAEVVVRNRGGDELGRYSPDPGTAPAGGDATMDADEVAGSLSETLGVPAAGSTLSAVLPFLREQPYVFGTGGNFSGVLFSIVGGDMETQRPLDEYPDLTLAFAPTETAALVAFREGAARRSGFGRSRPFGGLDCGTPGIADRCGLLRFEKAGEVDVLVDVVTVAEIEGVRYDAAAAVEPFDAEAIASMDRVEAVVGYTKDELGGQGNVPVGARAYYAGGLRNEALPLHDLLGGMSGAFSAKTMLWTIDGQGDRTVFFARSSFP